MRSIGPAVTREQSPAFLRNSDGRLDFPGPTQEASRIPRRNSRIPPQLEKNHVVPPSSKSVQMINAGEGVEKRESLNTVDGNVNWCSHCGKQYGVSLKKQKQSYHMIQHSHSRVYIQKI